MKKQRPEKKSCKISWMPWNSLNHIVASDKAWDKAENRGIKVFENSSRRQRFKNSDSPKSDFIRSSPDSYQQDW